MGMEKLIRKNLLFSVLVLFLFILLNPITTYASFTPAGTIIINGGDNGRLIYQDGVNQPGDVILRYKGRFVQGTITSNPTSTTVLQGYGLAPLAKLQNQLLGGSRTIYYTYTLTNTGNGTDTITISLQSNGTWGIGLIIPPSTETITTGSMTLLQDESKNFYLKVVVGEGNEGDNVTTVIKANCFGTDTWGNPDMQIATVTTGFDITAPKISHTPITKIGMLGNKVIIRGTITDGTVVDAAFLYYGTTTLDRTGTMSSDVTPAYSYTIPPELIGTAGITYQIWATDGLNATTTQKYQIEVCLTTIGTITEKGGTVTVLDGNSEDGNTQIILPAGLAGTVAITQKAVEETPPTQGNFLIQSDKPAALYEFKAPQTEFTKQVTITMLYLDLDNDGKEDITGANELTLKAFYWNDNTRQWELVGGLIDPIKNTITIEVTHLSQFAIFPSKKPAANRLSKVFVYPNPCYTNSNYQLTFAGLTKDVTIKIFNIAGELVRTLEKDDPGQVKEWDLRNDAGEKVASGIYIYLVIDNDTGERVTGKLGVLR